MVRQLRVCYQQPVNDIRDLLSGHLHVEQIVFTQAVGLDSDQSQTHCYLGAASTGRFLLMSLSSPPDADHPVELAERGWIYGRSAETDFVTNSGQPLIASRPRSQREPDLEKVFKSMESILMGVHPPGLAVGATGEHPLGWRPVYRRVFHSGRGQARLD